MLRFIISLIISKLYIFITELFSKNTSDKVGILAYKICPSILTYINKPKLVIMVTGTNGKTTTTSLIANMFKENNKKVIYNYWGANMLAGHIRTLLDSVSIFNKSKYDVCVLETDEIALQESIGYIKPEYLLITNICRDSIRRNAYPDYIYNILDKGINLSKDTKLIINAMDPISSSLGSNNPKIYISALDVFNNNSTEGLSPEVTICPLCNSEIKYDYRHYRHIGKYHCTKCNYTNYEGKYILESINKELIINKESYHIISNEVYNIYNEIMIIGLFKELGYTNKEINDMLKEVNIPKTRGGEVTVNGIKVIKKCGKAQNGSNPSIIFESILKDSGDKELIFLLDEEIYFGARDTITWLYDNDFELLNNNSIKKIILSGRIPLDFKLRLILAGYPIENIVVCKCYKEVHNYVSLNNNIYIIHDIDLSKEGSVISDNIVKLLERK